MSYEYTKQVESLDGLSTVEVLRWIVFLYESLHSSHGEAKLLFMIEALLRRIRADTASGMREDPD